VIDGSADKIGAAWSIKGDVGDAIKIVLRS